jgi:hypothetical protein
LTNHLAEIDSTAKERMSLLTTQMKERDGVTETLKQNDQMKWIRMMNNITHSSEEVILDELIYS